MMSENMRSPTRLIGELEAAARQPTTVKPGDLLETATAIMRDENFSQLPVMTDDSEVVGMITWKSIGLATSIDGSQQFVHECMDRHVLEAGIDDPLLSATSDIAEHDYVLIRGDDGSVTGIVTASDFAVEFKQLAEPFLVIEEIETHLRQLISGRFCVDELKGAVAKWRRKYVHSPDDLNLGAYRPLLDESKHWDRLGLDICKDIFLDSLDSVTEIRNHLMHFRPGGPEPGQLKKLDEVAKFFREMDL